MHQDMIRRIVTYDRNLRQLKQMGFERVFANNIGDPAGIPATVVRKDFSLLHIIGQKRGGYEIDRLIESLDRILGKEGYQNAAVVGCGRIGGAILRYGSFGTDGIKIVAGFDVDTRVCEQEICPVPVYPMDGIETVIQEKEIRLAVIAVPEHAALEVYNRLLAAGVRGFLNFSSSGLKTPRDGVEGKGGETAAGEHIVLHTINIGLELEQIVCELNIADSRLMQEL